MVHGRRPIGAFALVIAVFAAPFLLVDAAEAQVQRGSNVGVYVEPIPTTLPPPTTSAPVRPGPTAAPTTPTPTTAAPAKGDLPTTTLPVPLTDAGDGIGLSNFPNTEPSEGESKVDKGVVGSVKSMATAARKTISDVLKGKPVADAVEELLPEPVAAVVVPAIRTASTFAFPIGLAAAVFGFLAIQQRIDSADPKLTAAPMAHDDDVVYFE